MKIGIDSIDIDRIKNIADKNNANRVFTEYELEYANDKHNKYQTLAGIFCAKESFLKAISKGLFANFSLNEIEIKHLDSGQPYIVKNDKLHNFLALLNIVNIELSITHTDSTATAICLLY